MAGGGTTARGFLIFLGVTFLLLLWDAGELVRLQRYVQSKVSVVSNWGTHFTSCSSKNPLLQGFSCPPISHRGIIGMDETIATLTDSMRSCKSLGASLGVGMSSTLQTF